MLGFYTKHTFQNWEIISAPKGEANSLVDELCSQKTESQRTFWPVPLPVIAAIDMTQYNTQNRVGVLWRRAGKSHISTYQLLSNNDSQINK